jgi:ribosome-binding factor A
MPSITRVKVSNDLTVADVYVTIMGTPGQQSAALNALKHSAGMMRTKLTKVLSLRQAPYLKFHIDEQLKKEIAVLDLLRKVREEDAERAAAAGVEVMVDLDYRADQWRARGEYSRLVSKLLSHATLTVGTEEEVIAAADRDDLDAAIAHVLDAANGPLVVKRGGKGASIYAKRDERRDIAPFRITVLNVLGAGDAFASGLIAGLRRGWPLDRAVRFGNATGAIVVTRHGCANFMPTMEEVESFVADQGGW